jgi:hypothetical protein
MVCVTSSYAVLISLHRHKYTMFLSTDGNFRLQQKHKHDDPDDVALNKGSAYFVENSQYKKYLSVVRPCDEVHNISFSILV